MIRKVFESPLDPPIIPQCTSIEDNESRLIPPFQHDPCNKQHSCDHPPCWPSPSIYPSGRVPKDTKESCITKEAFEKNCLSLIIHFCIFKLEGTTRWCEHDSPFSPTSTSTSFINFLPSCYPKRETLVPIPST